jgi:hypothetical protein
MPFKFRNAFTHTVINNTELLVLSLLPQLVQAHSDGDYPSTAPQYLSLQNTIPH